jgi:predicted ATPase
MVHDNGKGDRQISSPSADWNVILSNRVAVEGPHGLISEFPTRRSALILVRVAINPGVWVSRDQLAALLWPDEFAHVARPLLRNELARLRKALGEAAVIVESDRLSVRLNLDFSTTDLREAEKTIQQATAISDIVQANEVWKRLVPWTEQHFLPEVNENWLGETREHHRQLLMLALTGIARSLTADGESTRAALVRARIVQMREQADLDHGLPDQAAGVSSQSEDVYSLLLPSNLPNPLSAIIGRQPDIEAVSNLLIPSHEFRTRLVTLRGPGGIGKSRLSIAVGQRLMSEFEDRVWYIPLVDQDDGHSVGHAILDSLNIDRRVGSDAFLVLKMRLPKSPCLLVLDNFEQLVDGGASVLKRLLEENGQLSLLVTSRRRLDLAGEVEYEVTPLRSEHGISLYRSSSGSSTHSGSDPELLRLIERLDGIPLAIQIAASYANVLTVSETLSQLEDRFDFLVSPANAAEERHRRLLDTIDWGFRLLPEEAKTTFLDLSVFRGGASLSAIAEILQNPKVHVQMERLVAFSFVVGYSTPLGARFRLLETLREYALRNLSPEQSRKLAKRHSDFYFKMVETAFSRVPLRIADQNAPQIELESDNIRAALRYTIDFDRPLARHFVHHLYEFWSRGGQHVDARRWLEEALQPPYPNENLVGGALFGIGRLAFEQFDFSTAKTYFERSIGVFEICGPEIDIFVVKAQLSAVLVDEGSYREAKRLAQECIEYFMSVDGPYHASFAYDDLAIAELGLGDTEAALRASHDAIATRQHAKFPVLDADAKVILGFVRSHRGESCAARSEYEAALHLYREHVNLLGVGRTQYLLAGLDVCEGEFGRANCRLLESQSAWRAIGDLSAQGKVALLEARLQFAQQNTVACRQLAKAAARELLRLGLRPYFFRAIELIADSYYLDGEVERATRLEVASELLRTSLGAFRFPADRREIPSTGSNSAPRSLEELLDLAEG